MKNTPIDITCELSRIWQRVLKKEHIGIEENFFEAGGDPWLAIELFLDIKRVFGRSLPPIVIYQAPTIASLSALLEGPISPAFAKSVLLRTGTSVPPVFVNHGLGGNVMELFGFVNHLQCDQPIYGLQERGTDGLEEPCASIEEMAQFHVKTIRAIAPAGPYILIGYSFGGLVALEIARHLTETGGKVALLVMIDAYLSLKNASLLQQLFFYSIRTRNYAIRKLLPNLRKGTPGRAFTPAMRHVEKVGEKALRKYWPRCYQGCIRFVRSDTHLSFPDQEQIWTKVTKDFVVESVTGNHLELMRTYHDNLATVISRYLGELSVRRHAVSSPS
jgi:pimeloyl-ACP methyl ester carboxylesterase